MVCSWGACPTHQRSKAVTLINFDYIALPSHSNEALLAPKEQLIPAKPQRDPFGQLLRAAVSPLAYVAALFIVLISIDQ